MRPTAEEAIFTRRKGAAVAADAENLYMLRTGPCFAQWTVRLHEKRISGMLGAALPFLLFLAPSRSRQGLW
jgi:hypothetical protein